jgi:hypothetical protein
MDNDTLVINQQQVRGTDSNSLLRLYDLANKVFTNSASPKERERADKAIQRISKELQKRKVALNAALQPTPTLQVLPGSQAAIFS